MSENTQWVIRVKRGEIEVEVKGNNKDWTAEKFAELEKKYVQPK
jgi:UPF0288 family protein (methanogenesis marker protein 3)